MVNKFVNDIKNLKTEKEELQKELDDVAEDKIRAMNSMMSQLEIYKNNITTANNSLN